MTTKVASNIQFSKLVKKSQNIFARYFFINSEKASLLLRHPLCLIKNMKIFNAVLLFFLICTSSCVAQEKDNSSKVITGASQIDEYLPLLIGKNVAVVANPTSLIGKTHLVDTLINLKININVIFAPEHGFRGDAEAGGDVESGIDAKTHVNVISLYGEHNKPSKADLNNIDVVLFDIQDVGVRFYTYISTLQYVMEACAESNKKLILLDRPNPLGNYVDGPVLELKYKSFVGMQAVPIVYGMTIGEYAKMLNGEHKLKDNLSCDLMIIRLKNWNHNIKYILPIKPSPNLPNQCAIKLYPSLCFFEGTKVSVGRGTDWPFQIIGFPENKIGSFIFKPISIPGFSLHPMYEGMECKGISLTTIDYDSINKVELKYLLDMYKNYPNKELFFNSFFEKLAGTDTLKKQIVENITEEKIRESWKIGIDSFKIVRKKYLLYKDYE